MSTTHSAVMFQVAVKTLAQYADEWDAAVASGSIDAQLAVGRKLRSGVAELLANQ